MNKEDEIKIEFSRMCKELNIEDTMDFGIINADGKRTNEFLEYIERNQDLPTAVRYSFFELIMASMNASILEQNTSEGLNNKFEIYLSDKIGNSEWYPMVDYWIGIKSKDEFPVGYLIEAIYANLNRIINEYANSFLDELSINQEIELIMNAAKVWDLDNMKRGGIILK